MMKSNKKKLVGLFLAALLALPACGKTDTVVTDYGATESTNTASNSEDTNKKSDNGSGLPDSSGKTLSEMLGGSQLEYSNNFSIDGKSAEINVIYNVNDTNNIAVYNVEPLTAENVNENEIVEKIFGGTGVAIQSSDREYLNFDKGDSQEIVYSAMAASYRNNDTYNYMSSTHKAWIDEATYYSHTYEGTYNNTEYQLLISFSQTYNELIVALYPKDISKATGDDNLKYVTASCPDGNIYYYKDGLKSYNIPDIMSDRPNECKSSEEELNEKVTGTLKDILNLSFPNEGLIYDANLHEIVIPSDVEIQKNELVFFSDASFESATLEGAVRNGYQAAYLYSLCGLPIMPDTSKVDDSEAEEILSNTIYVNDSGVIGFDILAKYNFNETVSDSVGLLKFSDAMNCFVEESSNNLTNDMLKKSDDKIVFNSVNLEYYPIELENGTTQLTPVWALEADNSKKETIARVIINATDGSYVTTLFEED